MTKLNLGGGKLWAEKGWQNLEYDLGYDLAETLLTPYEDNSVDIIYTSHALEHLPWDRIDLVLKDCFRVLKPEGLFRIVLPDVDTMWKVLQSGSKSLLQKNNSSYYCGSGAGKFTVEQCIFELFGYTTDGKHFLSPRCMHTAFFTPSIIGIMLRAAGFKKVETWDFCKSNLKELETEMSHRRPPTRSHRHPMHGFDNPDTQDISLYVECVK
jgi:ubiquinone/menaquinone biosynthesis C-methylase UbiE